MLACGPSCVSGSPARMQSLMRGVSPDPGSLTGWDGADTAGLHEPVRRPGNRQGRGLAGRGSIAGSVIPLGLKEDGDFDLSSTLTTAVPKKGGMAASTAASLKSAAVPAGGTGRHMWRGGKPRAAVAKDRRHDAAVTSLLLRQEPSPRTLEQQSLQLAHATLGPYRPVPPAMPPAAHAPGQHQHDGRQRKSARRLRELQLAQRRRGQVGRRPDAATAVGESTSDLAINMCGPGQAGAPILLRGRRGAALASSSSHRGLSSPPLRTGQSSLDAARPAIIWVDQCAGLSKALQPTSHQAGGVLGDSGRSLASVTATQAGLERAGLQVVGFADTHQAMRWADAHIERMCCAVLHLALGGGAAVDEQVRQLLRQCAQRDLPALVLTLAGPPVPAGDDHQGGLAATAGSAGELRSAPLPPAPTQRERALHDALARREKLCAAEDVPLFHTLQALQMGVLQTAAAGFAYVGGRLTRLPPPPPPAASQHGHCQPPPRWVRGGRVPESMLERPLLGSGEPPVEANGGSSLEAHTAQAVPPAGAQLYNGQRGGRLLGGNAPEGGELARGASSSLLPRPAEFLAAGLRRGPAGSSRRRPWGVSYSSTKHAMRDTALGASRRVGAMTVRLSRLARADAPATNQRIMSPGTLEYATQRLYPSTSELSDGVPTAQEISRRFQLPPMISAKQIR
jgi:hypothetical protein